MAADLLSTIRREIDGRLQELRPLQAEYEQLHAALAALGVSGRGDSSTVTKANARAGRAHSVTRAGAVHRGSAAGVIKRAARSPEIALNGQVERQSATSVDDARGVAAPARSTVKTKPERAARGAARDAILAALEHGSHTVGELSVVTAMSGPNISGNLRTLASEGVVVKTEREGKAAWARLDMLTTAA
jgi:hypothetical protein